MTVGLRNGIRYLVYSYCEEARTPRSESSRAVKDADPRRSLDRLVPKGEVEDTSGEDTRFRETKKEPSHEEM